MTSKATFTSHFKNTQKKKCVIFPYWAIFFFQNIACIFRGWGWCKRNGEDPDCAIFSIVGFIYFWNLKKKNSIFHYLSYILDFKCKGHQPIL
jgi:hypothetical protein